ncbi:MAG: hypothetical protein PHE32_00610 [Candidatus Shapirobacteria bacterium]|nr:hypothetical protein [Candidatus Shapirobacteria bacterium]MDD4410198.1 hypothetical protein [Candidatus Shapirobacteria bacterium]
MSLKLAFYRLIFVLFFLIIPLFQVTPIFAETPTPTYTCKFIKYTDPNILAIIWAWITSLFEKPYDIDTNRSEIIKAEDVSDFGNVDSPEYKEKHAYPGSRSTFNNTQSCLKGKIIKDVLLGQANDKPIGTICLDNSGGCTNKTISDLALYLNQTNQQFICDQNEVKINTPSELLAKINLKPSIPDYEIPCYSGIYDDFFLTPVNNISTDTTNTIKIMDQPIPYQNQDQNKTITNQKAKLNNFFSSQSNLDTNKANGLEGLRPEGW